MRCKHTARPQKGGVLDKALPCLCGTFPGRGHSCFPVFNFSLPDKCHKTSTRSLFLIWRMPVVIWFLKTLHSKSVIFLVYALKETDGENHRGEKANKIQSPRFQHSWWYHRIHAGPQTAFKRDQHFASGQTQSGQTAIHSVTSESTSSWSLLLLDIFLLNPSLGWLSCQLRVLSSEESADCSVSYRVSSSVVTRPFLPAWHSTQIPFYCPGITETQPPRNTKV